MSSLNQSYNESTPCCGINLQPFRSNQRQSPSGTELQNPEIDNMLSEAMNNLTFEERQEQQDVLHGVNEQLDEGEHLVKRSLEDLENTLNRIKRGSFYEMAERMNPDYVHARAFRIMFLRGNRYDIKDSAQQMLRFFEQKRKLFGEEKLVKDITIYDLDEDDLACLRSGAIQVLGRDTSNRQILIMVPSLRAAKTSLNELRSIYYVFMTALKSEETQLHGYIALLYTAGNHKDSMRGAGYVESLLVSMSLPLWNASTHNCGDSDTAESVLWNMAIKLMPAKRRARVRLHFGSHMECLYKLSTYGISSQMLPFYPESTVVNLDNHQRWCNSCFEADAPINPDCASSTAVIVTNANDVLYIGKRKNNNVGNQRLRALVRDYSSIYDNGTNDTKREVVDQLLCKVREWGGRFLQQQQQVNAGGEQTEWVELDVDDSRAKVAQLFRNHRRRPDASRNKTHSGVIISESPRPIDVVFGKGRQSQGSELLRHFIRKRSDEYDLLDRGKKRDLVDSIINHIKGQEGRFLQPTETFGEFLEVTDDMARARISKYFRNHRRAKKHP